MHGTNNFTIKGYMLSGFGSIKVALAYTWNDKIDPNLKDDSDKAKATFAKNFLLQHVRTILYI